MMHRYGQIDLCNLAFHLTFGIGVDTLCMHVFMDAQKNVYSCICSILSNSIRGQVLFVSLPLGWR